METNSELSINEKIESKNWKDRVDAYKILKAEWASGDYSNNDLLIYIQNEASIPALEAGMEALIENKNITTNDVRKLLVHVGSSKTSIKEKMAIIMSKLNEKDELVEELCVLIENKAPKIVEGAVTAITDVIKDTRVDVSKVGEKINMIMSNSNKNVRNEGIKLCVELYKRIGENISVYIEKLKPIQIKELEEEFKKCEPVEAEEEEIVIERNEALPKDFYERVESSNYKDRLEVLTELNAVARSIPLETELSIALARRLSDNNNQVFLMVMEILCKLKLKGNEINRCLFERFKDKKSSLTDKIKETLWALKVKPDIEFLKHKNPQVKFNILDYSLKFLIEDESFIKAVDRCSNDSSPDVRNKAIEYLSAIREKMGGKLDSMISQGTLSKLKVQKNKNVGTKVPKVVRNEPLVNKKVINDNSNLNSKGNTCEDESKLDLNELLEGDKAKILERFYLKYPFFNEKKEWNLRLEDLVENTDRLKNEDPYDLAFFFYAHKESNFKINLHCLDILISKEEELCNAFIPVCAFCFCYVTDIKCKPKIRELFEILSKIDRSTLVKYIWSEICKNKSGKRFVELIDYLGTFARKGDVEVEKALELSCTGIAEKKAQSKFKDTISKKLTVNKSPVPGIKNISTTNTSSSTHNLSTTSPIKNLKTSTTSKAPSTQSLSTTSPIKNLKPSTTNTLSPIQSLSTTSPIRSNTSPSTKITDTFNTPTNTVNTQTINNIVEENKVSPIQKNIVKKRVSQNEVLLKLINKHRVKGTGRREDVFTPEFIKLMDEGPIHYTLDLFDSIDKTLVSDFLIDYLIQNDANEAMLNSTILSFISQRYILKECECKKLLEYLLENNMEEELQMMDRIYPVTKLFNILQKIGSDVANNEILRLVKKYKMFRGDKKQFISEVKKNNKSELNAIIKGCPDFLSFVDEVEGSFLSVDQDDNIKRINTNGDSNITNNKNYNNDDNKNYNNINNSKDYNNIGKKKDYNINKDYYNTNDNKNYNDINNKNYNDINNRTNNDTNDNKYNISNKDNKNYYNINDNNRTNNDTNDNKDNKNYYNINDSNSNINKDNISNKDSNGKNNINVVNSVREGIKKPTTFPTLLNSMGTTKDNDSFIIEDADIEASIDALSICGSTVVSTPNLKKFRKEFETPTKELDGLELVLDHLIDSNSEISLIAFKKLLFIAENDIDKILFSANSIISSISIQLFDVLDNTSLSLQIIKVLSKLSQSKKFCKQLRKETLFSVNQDLIKIMRKTKKNEELIEISSAAGDILINLCLNSRPGLILEAYLEMLEKSRDELLLKLIWRHSKTLNVKNKEEVEYILKVLTSFYENNYNSILKEENVTLKILQLHLKEIVKYYKKNIYEFEIKGLTKVFVECLIENS